jgi:hypothetical protein
MKNIQILLKECRELGAIFTPLKGSISIQAPEPLPEKLIVELKQAKPEILAELQKYPQNGNDDWLLEEWRKTSIPNWRRILQGSIDTKNVSREEYARWMLKEMLEDPEYLEEK